MQYIHINERNYNRKWREEAIYDIFLDSFDNEILSGREFAILCKKFGLDGGEIHTYEEISRDFDLSRERVRQILYKSLEKIKHCKKFQYTFIL